MAHRLYGSPDSKCFVPHGHNEIVTVTLVAFDNERLDGKSNVVVRFSQAKGLWHQWIDNYVDHAFQISDSDPILSFFSKSEPSTIPRLMIMPGDPTTELLAVCFKSKLTAFLDAEGVNLRCKDVSIKETTTNLVLFEGDPSKFLPSNSIKSGWWMRSDMSINNFS